MTSLPSRSDRALAWLVLAVFLALTLLVTYYVWSTTSDADRARFDNAVQTTRDAIAARVDAYTSILAATRGLVVSNPALPREDLRAYIRSLNVQQRYPGIRDIGMSIRVPRGEIASLQRELRLRVWPAGEREEYYPVVLVEPLDSRNAMAVGYDMLTSPARRQAMERARDTGRAAASAPISLTQKSDETPGFLIFTPLYSTGTTPSSIAERRAALVGFLFSRFRAHDFFEGIFPSQQRPEIGFEIRDENQFVYHTVGLPEDPRFTAGDRMLVAGRTWTIRWISRRHAGGGVELLTAGTLLGGIAISVLLFLLVRTQLRARAEAERIAQRLRESEGELQRANRAKDDFLATLSHELRTPMTSIMGWAQMLADNGIDPETQRTGIDAIGKSAKVQAQLIDDLLDVSRITAGKMNIERRSVELRPVIIAAMETVQGAAEAKGVELHPELAEDVRVNGDPHRLQQVIWNLLSNAVKFTPAGGRVSIALREEARDAVIEVRDTGQGIDPSFMPYLFERFRQADGSATRTHMGLGLGLAIVRHLVELHGGTVSAESGGIGRGATFRVRLPRSFRAEDPSAPAPAVNSASSRSPEPALRESRSR